MSAKNFVLRSKLAATPFAEEQTLHGVAVNWDCPPLADNVTLPDLVTFSPTR